MHSPIVKPEDMPFEGVISKLEVFEEFADALDGIDEYSHIIVLLYYHQAQRGTLKVKPKRGRMGIPEKGVFATRSPARPNPIGLNVVKVLSRDKSTLTVDSLDAVDDTPIVDIKPYLSSCDCVFSAKSGDRFEVIQKMPRDEVLMSMLREASNFHGDTCAGVAIGVRIVYKAYEILKYDLRCRDLKIISGARACITDGVQALTGATSKRLRIKDPLDQSLTFQMEGRTLRIVISGAKKFRQPNEVLMASDTDLFAQIEENALNRS